MYIPLCVCRVAHKCQAGAREGSRRGVCPGAGSVGRSRAGGRPARKGDIISYSQFGIWWLVEREEFIFHVITHCPAMTIGHQELPAVYSVQTRRSDRSFGTKK